MNPHGWDSNLVKTQFGTLTHVPRSQTWPKLMVFQIEITHLVSGPNEAQVLDVLSQKEFSERQSDRYKVDLFRFREKHTPQTECGPSQRASARQSRNVSWLVLIGWVISYANEWEDYSTYFREGAEISRIWATIHSLVF